MANDWQASSVTRVSRPKHKMTTLAPTRHSPCRIPERCRPVDWRVVGSAPEDLREKGRRGKSIERARFDKDCTDELLTDTHLDQQDVHASKDYAICYMGQGGRQCHSAEAPRADGAAKRVMQCGSFTHTKSWAPQRQVEENDGTEKGPKMHVIWVSAPENMTESCRGFEPIKSVLWGEHLLYQSMSRLQPRTGD